MSFMTNPYPFDDTKAMNRPELPKEAVNAFVSGEDNVLLFLRELVRKNLASGTSAFRMALDGCNGVDYKAIAVRLKDLLESDGYRVLLLDAAALYKASSEIERMISPFLPVDPVRDPVSLFGKLHEWRLEDLLDSTAVAEAKSALLDCKRADDGTAEVAVCYGCGAAGEQLVPIYDTVIYFDLTHKEVSHRVNSGVVRNLGDNELPREKSYIFRRLYYIDYEVTDELKNRLLKAGDIDFYVDANISGEPKLLPGETLAKVMSSLVRYPVRAKPVYIPGVWGGQWVKQIRHLPEEMKNCAWSFEMIPPEVSVQIAIGDSFIDIPFMLFTTAEAVNLMGEDCVREFKGAFPIRFNYDDTMGGGHMSIQVHPHASYAEEHFGEQFQQDESYYVVKVEEDGSAGTHMGLKNDADKNEFFKEARRSEKDMTSVDYEKYINRIPSRVGDQFLIPGGTVHGSGRNQVVLEIGSCTVGSYTFKLYDYLRIDLNGKLRPIHTWHGENVLRDERRADWVAQNLHQKPRLIREGDGWAEFLIGEREDMFFKLQRLEFAERIEDTAAGKFHVLCLVEGESVQIRSKEHDERSFRLDFSEVVVVPACFGEYVIENLGNKPCKMTKTLLK
ncbi:MAG: class I mannose-6-phosphate isomerase [bacterium]|nr:class I mannose-6-phosphate isomerase [bacterium]